MIDLRLLCCGCRILIGMENESMLEGTNGSDNAMMLDFSSLT
jgi:hypothetical protein